MNQLNSTFIDPQIISAEPQYRDLENLQNQFRFVIKEALDMFFNGLGLDKHLPLRKELDDTELVKKRLKLKIEDFRDDSDKTLLLEEIEALTNLLSYQVSSKANGRTLLAIPTREQYRSAILEDSARVDLYLNGTIDWEDERLLGELKDALNLTLEDTEKSSKLSKEILYFARSELDGQGYFR